MLPGVQFTSDEEACLSQHYDLVFASNSLQYTEDWRGLLTRFARAARHWVLLTRLPLVETAKAFVVVQRPHWVGYHTEYVSWVFNRHELLDHAVAEGLVLEREFLMAAGSSRITGAPEPLVERGFLFRAPDKPFRPVRPHVGG
jgi:putative methyltransferase (TIGR04325 family)